MPYLAATIGSTDPDFRAHVTWLLRSSGQSITVIDERQAAGPAPDLAIADARAGGSSAAAAIEQLRSAWPSSIIFAVAAANDPDQILQAMRAGANEFLVWPHAASPGSGAEDAFRGALQRTVDRLRTVKEGEGRSCLTLSFLGAKGGAGTTTLAVNCAVEIARTSSRPTLIIDFHQFVGEVALFLGVRPRFTLVDALDNLHRLDAAFLRELVTRHKSGLDMLAGTEHIDRPGPHDTAALEQLLRFLARSYDFIVIDAGPLTNPCAEIAVHAADTIFLVANPDVASVRNARRLTERLTHLGAGQDRVQVLLNRTSDQHVIAPKQIEAALGCAIRQTFASDYGTVSTALNSGVPLTLSQHTELAAQFGKFTRSILGVPLEAEPTPVRRFSGQFLGMF